LQKGNLEQNPFKAPLSRAERD